MGPSKSTVFVVDDDLIYRKLLQGWLTGARYSVEVFASAEDFLSTHNLVVSESLTDPLPRAIAGEPQNTILPFPRPGCLILDIQMPGMDGLGLQNYLAEQRIFVPIIILTGHADVATSRAVFRAGAIDFLPKPCERQQLLASVAEALAADEKFRHEYAQRTRINSLLATLSNRERQILELIVARKSMKQIASQLHTSPHTVRNQRASLLKKMQAESDACLVSMLLLARSDVNPWR